MDNYSLRSLPHVPYVFSHVFHLFLYALHGRRITCLHLPADYMTVSLGAFCYLDHHILSIFLTSEISLVTFSLYSILLFEHNIPSNPFEEINYVYFTVLFNFLCLYCFVVLFAVIPSFPQRFILLLVEFRTCYYYFFKLYLTSFL